MADGGEGTIDVVDGIMHTTTVCGPLGHPVDARWVMKDDVAVVEMAQASGLLLAGGAAGNDPMNATTQGTGELIATAIEAGARRIVVGVGGSSTTDGGRGCLDALIPRCDLGNVEIVAVTDVATTFLDSARIFGPQKGATAEQISLLEERLARIAEQYETEFGVDVRNLPGSGAAGGLAGALVAVGAKMSLGFDYFADLLELKERAAAADLVITGEGKLDATSSLGKVPGGIATIARNAGVPLLVVAGTVDDAAREASGFADVTLVSLIDCFGRERAFSETASCIETAVREHLEAFG